MVRVFIVLVGVFALAASCTQRLVCPAYQSSFIHDQESLRKKFSYFQEDSTPKVLTASKNKYLVAVPESYRRKYRRLQTVEMKPVYPVIPDSLKVDEGADVILAEADIQDSAAIAKRTMEPGDSAYAITKTKEKYNLDQDLYMWYFRDVLVLPDVRASMEKKEDAKSGNSAKTKKKEKRGIKGFFANLFKKKQKPDSLATVAPPPVDPDSDAELDSTATVPVPPQEQPKKKGGLFGRKKKDKQEKEKPPAKKEDDGF